MKLLSTTTGSVIPTGSMTALFGAPVIILLLANMRNYHRGLPGPEGRDPRHLRLPRHRLLIIALMLIVALLTAVVVGRAPNGQFEMLPFAEWPTVLPYRWPRIVAGIVAAIMLECSGVILQRLTGNEMAGPEILGISAGATSGVAVAIFPLSSTSYLMQVGFAATGSLAVLGLVFLLAFRSGFAPERMLLTGVVLTAMLDALIGFLSAGGDPRAMVLVSWMSGSTYLVEPTLALSAAVFSLVVMTAVSLMYRWLDLLSLGEALHAVLVWVSPRHARYFSFCQRSWPLQQRF